ncbi:MAG: hypothetical protein HWD61_12850 [Parachlamydiaceae bacterium]|nr:MAG: hypothetical protein HWD61_12850 [Parachlamydiaceae bacterium]
MKEHALFVAGLLFALIALIHLSRLYFHFSILIGSIPIPYWANVVGLILFAALSFGCFTH